MVAVLLLNICNKHQPSKRFKRLNFIPIHVHRVYRRRGEEGELTWFLACLTMPTV